MRRNQIVRDNPGQREDIAAASEKAYGVGIHGYTLGERRAFAPVAWKALVRQGSRAERMRIRTVSPPRNQMVC